MPNGRAVLLFRRLSGDNRLKGLNLNQNTKEPLALNPVCCHRDSSLSKRLSTFGHNNLSTQLVRSYSDNIIKMSNSSTESKEKPKYTNRLITEKSPYLLQHAHNPVQWYPWCQEAIDKAKNEDKLIFLSVGYSTCHWCHVMEREPFENEEVAAVMNENFVNVKVDREERPDIDRIYMMYLTSTTGRGGWPMSIFITPDLLPVFGGTYFQPEDRPPYPGFKTLMNIIASAWNEKKQQCVNNGHEALELLQKMACLDIGSDSESLKTVPTEETFNKAVERYISNFEPRFGGFNSAPKFPQASIFNFLFHYYARDKTHPQGKKCLDMCLYTLTKIAKGGIHDHIAGGFARYSVDNYWHVPHFEKMLYDQAQLAIAYTDAYLATKETFYADVVKDIIAYVKQDLRHESGGFYSAEDADSYPTLQSSEKKEGAFYVWDYDEINNLLSDKKINSIPYMDIFCEHFNVKKEGNIPRESDPHKELTNKNVLIIYGSKEDTAKIFKLSVEQIDEVLSECVNILNEVRAKRPRPHLDSKMLCSWNGLMIAGLAQAGQGLGEKQYVEDAIKTANFVKQYLYDSTTKTLYHSCYRAEDGSVTQTKHPIKGFLDDYAFLIKGLLDLYEASLDLSWLNWARDLQDKQNELFWDSEDGAFFTCTSEDDTVVLRLKDEQDGAEPSGNSVSCHNLQRLAAYADKSVAAEGGDSERRLAQLILCWFAPRLRLAPSSMPEMLSACMFYNDSPTQVLIAGGCSDPRTLELVRAVRARLLPGRVLAVADPSALSDAGAAAVLSRIRCVGDAPTAYVCRRYACSLPVTDVKQLESILDEVSAKSTK